MNTQSNNLSQPTVDRTKDDNDLLTAFLVLLRNWKIILAFLLLGLALGILYTRYVNPTFKSDALVQIDNETQGVSGLGANISELVGPEVSPAQTEAQLIKSRMVLEPVVNMLNLRIQLTDPTIDYLDRIKRDSVGTQVNTNETVSLETKNGQAQISQFNVSPSYINKTFAIVRSGTGFVLSNGFDDFKGQLNQAHRFQGSEGDIEITVTDLPNNDHSINITKRSLQDATNALGSALVVEEQGGNTGIIQLSLTGSNQEQVSATLKQIVLSYIDQNQSRGSEETTKTIEFMETQIPVLKQKLESSETAFNNFRQKYGTIDVGQEAQLLLTESYQIDSQLNELNLRKAELTTYYTEEHPLVIQINDQLRVLNSRKQEIKNTVTRLPDIQREFLKLSEDVDIDRDIYLTMLKNYEQLKIVKAGQIGYARIVDLPTSTFRPIAPKKLQVMILATLLGLMLGIIVVMLKNLFRNVVVKDPNSIESKMGVPVIATILRSKSLRKLTKNKQSGSRLLAHVDHNGLSYEGIKSLRTYLMFGMPKHNQGARVILVSSESPNVGKSFVVANLAEVFSQLDKRVLVIDADLHLGSLHRTFNMSQESGLADYFSEEENTATSITHPTLVDNMDFIPRGQQVPNPASLLASEKFASLMEQLSAHYDYIIIDSPPVLAATDAVVLSQYADKVLMVARHNNSLEGQLAYAIQQMNKANVKVDGIVLNDVQQGVLDKHSYHYAYTYGTSK